MRRHVLAFLILSLSLAVVISLASMVSLALPVAAALSEVWVDDDFGSGTSGWGTTHFDTIQAGASAVDAGGTVHVAAGTYTVSLVNRRLEPVYWHISPRWMYQQQYRR